jgi:hypothetical protein
MCYLRLTENKLFFIRIATIIEYQKGTGNFVGVETCVFENNKKHILNGDGGSAF